MRRRRLPTFDDLEAKKLLDGGLMGTGPIGRLIDLGPIAPPLTNTPPADPAAIIGTLQGLPGRDPIIQSEPGDYPPGDGSLT